MASEFKACSVDSCNGNAHHSAYGRKGFCCLHFNRLKRHGDPLKTEKTPTGDPQRFYDSIVLSYEGNECLIWPYTRTKKGYPQIYNGSRMAIVSRILCEDVYGSPPTPDHQAAHSCGNGRGGCVTKGHMSWKTPAQNEEDKLVHGTFGRGGHHSQSKLTEKEAREILSLKGRETQIAIASKYGVSRVTVSDIHRGKRWNFLEGEK